MSRSIMLIPVGTGVGLTSVSMGMVRALERQGVKVNFFKPIAQQRPGDLGPERSTTIMSTFPNINPPEPMAIEFAEKLVSTGDTDSLLEEIVGAAKSVDSDSEVMVVEGLVPTRSHPFANTLNARIAKAMDADIVLVINPGSDSATQVQSRLEVAVDNFGGKSNQRILGAVVNKIGAPVDERGRARPDLSEAFDLEGVIRGSQAEMFQLSAASPVPILGAIPYNLGLVSPRASDLAKHLGARLLSAGDMHTRRLRRVSFCARSIPNMIGHLQADSLLVTSADRTDIVVSVCLAAMNGMKLGALLLTGGYELDEEVTRLCQQAFDTGLPVMVADTNTWQTALNIQNFNHEVPLDDMERIEEVQNYVASHIDRKFIEGLTDNSTRENRLSPAAFRYQLTELARQAKKRVVLPEGDEPRTVQAAAICAERGIAECILLGNPEEIRRVAEQQGVTLGDGVTIVDPNAALERYVAPMCELRRNKGLTEVVAREQLQDTVVLGTMMLAQDEVDGLVSGAVHTTANTIRPPLQLIKTAPGSSLVSSIFFMLLPDQVLVYGDCAINPDPNAEQLAEIAIQSADSAKAFGIEPKVAMISYSTGSSGAGADVEKVREATRIAQEKRPDLLIDGPLQYDAAVMPNVAASKAPNSKVAGQATVFIFPDLNTGNTTYKAVQRSADLISIGPMLQGMRKPVNDLSRGALVEDIVYTIALTAIQAGSDAV
ncbi:phosphate acetyltransferase [Ferrimonas lipolytica]|uniref:Phosphate acetyltransferase n=1 Tax=Ferrimonas lipolytica TaxID=2724191 RepID=A0A6H1U9X2_9GAMM|nr:phosphate acetyltransferase [Ferrimonas lipolytica]QIZ75855.1 phosphate acetyltransferase [Ferrimonas lipolytica]